MATIRRRGKKWQVQIRRKGRASLARSFLLKSDALAWARQKELEAERHGLATEHKALRRLSVAEIMVRYRDEVVPRKKGADREIISINAFLRQPLAQVRVSNLTTAMVSAYCDQRLTTVKASSVNRELGIFRHAFEVARRNWDIPITDNPFAMVTRKKASSPRTRRLPDGERKRLEDACDQCRNPHIRYLVELALETAMRRGEILNMRWRDVSFEKHTLRIPVTKNGHARTIPLSGPALSLLQALSDQRGFASRARSADH